MEKVRIDKWLWSVRIYKSRSLASDACRGGQISIKEKKVKPSYMLTSGETIRVKKGGFNFIFEVLQLIDKRVSAALAAPCYNDITPQEELLKYKNWYIGKKSSEKRIKGAGRPTKKERRTISDFKENYYTDEN